LGAIAAEGLGIDFWRLEPGAVKAPLTVPGYMGRERLAAGLLPFMLTRWFFIAILLWGGGLNDKAPGE